MRDGRTRERVCRCGAPYTQRGYLTKKKDGIAWQWTSPECRACYNARMLPISKAWYAKKRGDKFKRCVECGAKTETARNPCAACKATWKCIVCERSDRPKDSYEMCASCARTYFRWIKKGKAPT